LLPVSCGYFFNIVRQLIMKQRKFMIRYILLHTQGAVFDQLVKYIKYHSMADLLIELMQLTVAFQPPASSVLQDSDDGGEEKPALSEDQTQMLSVLNRKKREVVKQLIMAMSHSNRDDLEASLNASTVLIDLIEIEKQFEMFFENDGALVNLIIELAIDPTNSFNQPYLLAVLLAICKQLKPQSGANNLFKDLDEENEDSDSTKVS
jgi:hypothetical protein